jgi:aspartokinase-like uncharacterized kinase
MTREMTKGVRVVKIGGSLWSCPDLLTRLKDWLRQQPAGRSVLITGGGEYAEQIRRLDQSAKLLPETAHWLAVRGMSLLAWTLSQCNPAWSYLTDWSQLGELVGSTSPTGVAIFDPAHFLKHDEPHLSGVCLPIGWHVTSDAIAARIAELLPADELVLLKSALPSAVSHEQAALDGYVDAHFPRAAAGRYVRCVDLVRQGERQLSCEPRSPGEGLSGSDPRAANRKTQSCYLD